MLTHDDFPFWLTKFCETHLDAHAQAILMRLSRGRGPDLVIDRPDRTAYICRWHLLPRNDQANMYLHLQMCSDTAPPHDHPWSNSSLILAGGYVEVINEKDYHERSAGDVIYREAETMHRLFLDDHQPFALTLFTTGRRERDWGFLIGGKWVSHQNKVKIENGLSTYI